MKLLFATITGAWFKFSNMNPDCEHDIRNISVLKEGKPIDFILQNLKQTVLEKQH